MTVLLVLFLYQQPSLTLYGYPILGYLLSDPGWDVGKQKGEILIGSDGVSSNFL